MTGGLRKPSPACQIPKTSGRAHLRHLNICADTCAVGIKHHAVVRMEAGPQRLIRVEMHIARQQHLEDVVAVTLTKQISIVARPFDDLAVEVDIQRRIAVDLQLFRSDTRVISSPCCSWRMGEGSTPLRLVPTSLAVHASSQVAAAVKELAQYLKATVVSPSA